MRFCFTRLRLFLQAMVLNVRLASRDSSQFEHSWLIVESNLSDLFDFSKVDFKAVDVEPLVMLDWGWYCMVCFNWVGDGLRHGKI